VPCCALPSWLAGVCHAAATQNKTKLAKTKQRRRKEGQTRHKEWPLVTVQIFCVFNKKPSHF